MGLTGVAQICHGFLRCYQGNGPWEKHRADLSFLWVFPSLRPQVKINRNGRGFSSMPSWATGMSKSAHPMIWQPIFINYGHFLQKKVNH